jgi:hypothetical protein
MSRSFSVGAVISAYHNRLLVPFDEYRRFLDYMTGTELHLYDVAAARRAILPALNRQLPQLAEVPRPPDKTDSGNASRYVRKVAKELGADEVRVTPLKKGAFKARTPKEALK